MVRTQLISSVSTSSVVLLALVCKFATALNIGHSQTTHDIDIQERIAGGNLAGENQFPYQVGLNIEVVSGQFNWCGGSLISPQWILTAAHCVHSIVGVVAYLGSTNRLQPERSYRIALPNIRLHEEFNKSPLRNDIALMRLPSTVPVSDAISPVKLPKFNAVHSSYEYQEAIASGWGRENDVSPAISTSLKYIIRYTLTNAECQYIYGNSVQTSNICIDTTGGKSPCGGDSGGPLVIMDAVDGPVQIGLTSFGKSSGCTKGNPAVFTRLTSYLEWIYINAGVANI